MTAYYLRDDGYPTFKKIIAGRKWVGRVTRHVDGSYLGVIGNEMIKAPTEREAFEEISARAMGYPNAAALKRSNSEVRRTNKAQRQRAAYAVNEFLRGNFEPIGRALGLPKGRDR